MAYPIAKKTLLPFIRFFIRETKGLENVPSQGPFIIACKHIGSLDGVFIAASIIPKINQKIYFVSNVAKWGWIWEKIVAERWAGAIPFYKDNPKICLDIALDYLKKGRVVGIFPEGVLEDKITNGYKVKTGTARLAIWSKLPILPVGLDYKFSSKDVTNNMHSRWHVIRNTILNPHSISVQIGEPFKIDEYYNKELNKDILTEATGKIMNKINALTKVTINK